MTLEQTLQALYKSEINCSIRSMYDRGWYVYIGNDISEPSSDWYTRATWFSPDQFDQITKWLTETAIQLYPESEFAKQHKTGE